jgi:HlyD family secretion protein
MDRIIERSWLRRHGAHAGMAFAALLCTLALLWTSRDAPRVLRIDEGRVVVSAVTHGRFDDFVPVRAQVTPLRTIYLDAMEGGRVERVLAEVGALVRQGDPIVELSNTALQLDVISREAQVTEQQNTLRALELDLERNRLQHERDQVEIDYQITRLTRVVERRRAQAERGHIARADLEDAEDELAYYLARRDVTRASQASDLRLQRAQMEQLRTAAAQLEDSLAFARDNLDSLNVRAPMSGKLTALNAEVGQSLEAGERVGQIDAPEAYKLTALMDEFYLGRVATGQRATLAGGGGRTARVSKIFPQVNDHEFKIELLFDGQPPAGIRRGQTLPLNLELGMSSEAVLIPNGAFYQDTGGDWVFVLSADGSRAVRRDIRIGRRNGAFIEVLHGLEPGERVITSSYTNFLDKQELQLAAN